MTTNNWTMANPTGIYIPPYKMREMVIDVSDKNSEQYQRMEWTALRKAINGLINKVSLNFTISH